MFLAFRLVDIIQVPFGYLMSALYQLPPTMAGP